MAGINHKAELFGIVQNLLQRGPDKTDIVYEVIQHEDQFQAIVRLNGFEEEHEYAGAVCSTAGDAEQAAAFQALQDVSLYDGPQEKGPLERKVKSGGRGKPIDILGETSHPKTELNAYCQRSVSRSMAKQDIVYNVVQKGSQYQATVTLRCKENVKIVGEVLSSPKDAEASAALAALQVYKDEILAMNSGEEFTGTIHVPQQMKSVRGMSNAVPVTVDRAWGGKKRKTIDLTCNNSNAKTELNNFCQTSIGRSLKKDDIEYTVIKDGSGMCQATVTLHCRDGQQVAGEIFPEPKAAEMSAAYYALQMHREEIDGLNADLGQANGHASQEGAFREDGDLAQGAKKYKAIDVSGESSNPKTELNHYCQLCIGRHLRKEDIEYSLMQCEDQFQATVTLHCKGGLQVAGEPADSGKAAEMSAARFALEANAEEIAALNADAAPSAPPAKKRQKTQAPVAESSASENKQTLAVALVKVLGRELMSDDLVYTINEVPEGFQGVVSLHQRCGVQSGQWASQLCYSKKAAEQGAAGMALDDLRFHPGFGPVLTQMAASRKNKGAGYPMDTAPPWSKNPLTREPLKDVGTIIGEVADWKGTYGWIKPSEEIDKILMDNKHKGKKIYVKASDLTGGLTELAKGTLVHFTLYRDQNGLGAADVVEA